MHRNIPTPTDDEQTPPLPPPIQGNNQQDGAFNSQMKPEARNTETELTTRQSAQDMDENSPQKVNNGSQGNLGSDSQLSSGSMSEDHWKAKLSGAKQHWNKLEQEELLSTQGNSQQLSALIQKRYSTSKADADMQVKEFFNK